LIFFSFVLINTIFVTLAFGLTCAFYTFIKGVERSKIPMRDLPFVSIIVPARNEETKIARCLESLLKQDYPNFELIVIDDRSTDSTGEIIEKLAKRDKRITFVKGKDAPDGWIGKCNALAHAVGYASGDWYIFTDADTYHQPSSIRDAVSLGINDKADLVSFVPLQELGSFWEKLVMPTLLSSFFIGDPFHSVNDPQAKRAYAYGQYIMVRRTSYLAIGGHQSVRDEIVEDHAIGRVFKEKGYKILVADGKTLYSVRMYTDLESMWQGLTNNLYSLIDSSVIHLVLIIMMINMTVLVPWIQLAAVVSRWMSGDYSPTLTILTELVSLQLITLGVWWRLGQEHRTGTNWLGYFTLPFGGIAVTVLYIHAAYLVLSGTQVNWKGRKYRVNTHKTIESSSVGSQSQRKHLEKTAAFGSDSD
jgi:chlorobactene glucosyltransferase